MTPSAQLARDAWRTAVLSKVDPRHTALVIIDLQKDFCSSDGALAALGSDVSPCSAVAGRIADFLPRVRGRLSFVAFFQLIYDLEKLSESQQERLIRDGKPIICAPGSMGSELFIHPSSDDLVFTKHRYSAFSNERFRKILQERSITTVAVAGVDTHICVEGTVRQGYDLGYRMLVLSDLVATRSSESARHENSLALCERYFALTLTSDKFIDILQNQMIMAQQNDPM
jgi:ureidoacrylate peracid hydrolase